MKEKRYFFEGEIAINQTVLLEGDEFHHLSNVMRAKVGENVALFNGDGFFYVGKIKTISKKYAEIFIENKVQSENEPKVNLTVFQALAKGDKLSLIMQKITELGASKLVLFESKYCDVKANTNKAERMEQISISASKQCGRSTFVKSEGVLKLNQITQIISQFDAFFVAYENETGETLTDFLLNIKSPLKNIAIMIGSEGGFSEDEINLLKQNGAKIVSLGKRILRTETASITTTAIIMSILESRGNLWTKYQ